MPKTTAYLSIKDASPFQLRTKLRNTRSVYTLLFVVFIQKMVYVLDFKIVR